MNALPNNNLTLAICTPMHFKTLKNASSSSSEILCAVQIVLSSSSSSVARQPTRLVQIPLDTVNVRTILGTRRTCSQCQLLRLNRIAMIPATTQQHRLQRDELGGGHIQTRAQLNLVLRQQIGPWLLQVLQGLLLDIIQAAFAGQ